MQVHQISGKAKSYIGRCKRNSKGGTSKNTGQKQHSLSLLYPYLTNIYYFVILIFSLGWRNLYVRIRRVPLEAGNSVWNWDTSSVPYWGGGKNILTGFADCRKFRLHTDVEPVNNMKPILYSIFFDIRTENALFEGFQALSASPNKSIQITIGIEHWQNDTDREGPKYSETNLPHCHFDHHKSHINCPSIETKPPRWEVGD